MNYTRAWSITQFIYHFWSILHKMTFPLWQSMSFANNYWFKPMLSYLIKYPWKQPSIMNKNWSYCPWPLHSPHWNHNNRETTNLHFNQTKTSWVTTLIRSHSSTFPINIEALSSPKHTLITPKFPLQTTIVATFYHFFKSLNPCNIFAN